MSDHIQQTYSEQQTITARLGGESVPSSSSTVGLVDQQSQSKQKEILEPISLTARLTSCVPNSPNALVFFLFVVIYLICAMMHFVHTDDGGMLMTLLPYLAGYVGIPLVTPHIPWSKNKGNDRQD